uniref:Bifunctional inhibitor/plant lipid transfer protein/seed storage helical domain-containing protein n=1 Tax=Aegilops tauschii subsp. strangulata TaxID=200361 RepID=A0A453M1P5_AEGTS
TLGVALDGARALQMPAACRVQAPPASQCDSMGVPMSSPATPYDPEATPAGTCRTFCKCFGIGPWR